MFTGIVQGIASIEALEEAPGLTSFSVRFPPEHLQEVSIGASVALDGTCLTVTGQDGDAGNLSLADLGDAIQAYQSNPSDADIGGVAIGLSDLGDLIQYYRNEVV